MYDMTDPVAARRAAIAAEKERLTRARERRRNSGSAGASGFVQRKWRWVGVDGGEAVDTVLEVLKDIEKDPSLTEKQRNILSQALEGAPDREVLLPVVRAGMAGLGPDAVLQHLRALWAAGVRWLNEMGLERCRILCSTAPGIELVSTRSRAISGGPAFSLFATAATRGAIPMPNTALAQVLPWAPLSVLDDLVEHGGLLAEDEPWKARGEEEALYLRARLAPFAISSQEAERIGWEGIRRRRAFLAGETIVRQEPEDVWDLLYDVVRDVQLSSLDALDAALPRAQQIQLRDLRSGALVGQWDGDTIHDRGLWKLMAALWQPAAPVDPRRSYFYALVALNRAHDLLKSGDLEGARRQAESFVRERKSGPSLPTYIMDEAYSIAAYVAAVMSPEAENDRAAREQLALAETYAQKAAENGDPVAERNLAHVRTMRTKNHAGRMPSVAAYRRRRQEPCHGSGHTGPGAVVLDSDPRVGARIPGGMLGKGVALVGSQFRRSGGALQRRASVRCVEEAMWVRCPHSSQPRRTAKLRSVRPRGAVADGPVLHLHKQTLAREVAQDLTSVLLLRFVTRVAQCAQTALGVPEPAVRTYRLLEVGALAGGRLGHHADPFCSVTVEECPFLMWLEMLAGAPT
ncbi:hypothetical protein [Streptomyces sp. NPDC001410]|uniref:hypothetical protein n=1 Tax=Streptomyces sp. NPDC001410 TaxID=3364574 RepID=UPI003685DCEB